jgi:hypothetical protein
MEGMARIRTAFFIDIQIQIKKGLNIIFKDRPDPG